MRTIFVAVLVIAVAACGTRAATFAHVAFATASFAVAGASTPECEEDCTTADLEQGAWLALGIGFALAAVVSASATPPSTPEVISPRPRLRRPR